MFKIIPLPDNKGSVYSPFIIAALILITFSVSAYFVEDAASREGSIAAAGRVRKASSDMEELRTAAGAKAFLSLRSTLSSGGNMTDAEVEKYVAADMDAHVRGMGLSSVAGNYSFSLKDLSGGLLLLESTAAPTACLVDHGVLVCSRLSIETVLDKRWIS